VILRKRKLYWLTNDTINVSFYLNTKNSLIAKDRDIMKLITRDTDYSIRALIYIARNKDRIVSITELVKELDTPRPFLRKILQLLSARGVLKSYKGKNGGFALAKKPEKIYLLDLMEIFQGKFKLSECLFKKKICPNQINCELKSKLDSLGELVENKIKEITLASLSV
jgi:Rrf2 family protein